MDGIPLGEMNTSMTINATAAWLLALYIVAAENQGVPENQLQGTTQNDIIKEFLARGTYAFPPAPSMRLIADMIAYTVEHVPKWNPINICSYHLQEAGATPVQEIAYAMSNAIAVLDAARERVGGRRRARRELMEQVFGRISFFVNAGVRFVEEHAKLRAMSILWEELGRERYGVRERPPPALPLRRAGQLARADRGPAGEQRAADRARGARGHARTRRARTRDPAARLERGARAAAPVGPAVVAAHPAGARVRDRHPRVPGHLRGLEGDGGARAELLEGARAEMAVVAEHGGAVEAVPYMKAALVDSHRERLRRIEAGEQVVVGQNRFTETEVSPLTADAEGGILVVDPALEARADRGRCAAGAPSAIRLLSMRRSQRWPPLPATTTRRRT